MKDVILLNNLFNGKYIKENVGGEIINTYQSDNGKYYIYANPYGNINKKWDNRIKHVLFIRSIGNGFVKIIGKATIKKQISLKAVKKTGADIDPYQKEFIDENDITYGKVKVYELGSWSNYFVTFEAEGIYKANTDIYLNTKNQTIYPAFKTHILEKIERINNQSQKLYIEPNTNNYRILNRIINNTKLWESNKVGKVNCSTNKKSNKSFLSIIKKENDEFVNSNLLAHFLEEDRIFWSDFVEKVLTISKKKIRSLKPKITRESFENIDLLIEVDDYVIVIENKIKSTVSGDDRNGYSQLEKYVKKTKDYYKKTKCKIFYYLLRPDYNNQDISKFNEGKNYTEIKYSKIYEIIKDRKIDSNFEELKSVVKKHSADYDNELFEIMNERFIEQIKNKRK